MFKSSLLSVGICLALLVGNVHAVDPTGTVQSMDIPMPGGPSSGSSSSPSPRERDTNPAAANEAISAASQEISTQLNNILTSVNQGKQPDAMELQTLAAMLQKNRQYAQRMDAKGQANLQMLNAWMNYFIGEFKRAKIAANAAYKADPQNKDAIATLVAMSIASDDTKTAKFTVKALHNKKNAVDNGGEQRVLEFDPNLMKPELIDQKIGPFDAVCLNGTTLSFKGGKTLLMLLWSSPSGQNSDSSSPGLSMDFSQSGQTGSPMEAYASLFAKDFQNEKVAFLGLNLDPASDSNKVMTMLTKNPWQWPQAMAQDPRNAALASLSKLRSDKPSLVVIGADGAIKYAGQLSGLILQMAVASAKGGPELAAVPQVTQENVMQSNSAPAPAESKPVAIKTAEPKTSEPNTPPVQQTAIAPRPKAQLSEEEGLNPSASNLYQFALSQKRMAYATGWGTMVNACRQIIREYPHSSEAQKARELLREVPERKRAQYRITNEEMGL